MRLNELNDLAVDDGVEPHVAGFGKPAPELGHLLSLAICDADLWLLKTPKAPESLEF